MLEGAAFYTDRYVRTPDGWRITHTGYRRTFEVSMSTADLASYKVKRGTAYDAPALVPLATVGEVPTARTLPAAASHAVQRRLGQALRSRVAGDDARERAQRIWGAEGERWFTSDDPVWRVNADAAMFPGGSRPCCCSRCTRPRWPGCRPQRLQG